MFSHEQYSDSVGTEAWQHHINSAFCYTFYSFWPTFAIAQDRSFFSWTEIKQFSPSSTLWVSAILVSDVTDICVLLSNICSYEMRRTYFLLATLSAAFELFSPRRTWPTFQRPLSRLQSKRNLSRHLSKVYLSSLLHSYYIQCITWQLSLGLRTCTAAPFFLEM